MKYHYDTRILSGEETTPEFRGALELARNKGRWRHEDYHFFTTWWHIVTKLLDMNPTVRLPDGTTQHLFATVWEVRDFFRIENENLGEKVNVRFFMHCLSYLYSQKVAPREHTILETDEETLREIFECNIWSELDDCNSVMDLISKITSLSTMEISWLTEEVCEELILEIVRWIFGAYIPDDWRQPFLGIETKLTNEYTVWELEKDDVTDFFIDIMVTNPARGEWWVFSQVEDIGRRIQELAVLWDNTIHAIGSKQIDRRRQNTKYL